MLKELIQTNSLKRWITPLLITFYVVAVLMISGLSKARTENQNTDQNPAEEATATNSIGDRAVDFKFESSRSQ